MKITDIIEAYTLGSMMDIPSTEYQKLQGAHIPVSNKIADVRSNLELFCYKNETYYLLKNKSIVVGQLKLVPAKIAGKDYLSVAILYVDIPYRKTSATYWLLYSVKETVNHPVIADGVIFKDGQELINAIQKHKYLNVKCLNKKTGEVSELTAPINDPDHCYVFYSADIGFGKQMFESGLPYTWYPLFEEI